MTDTEVITEQAVRRRLLTQRLAAAGSLAEGLAHELHNPLNCAILQLAVLQRRLEQLDCDAAALQPVAALVEQALRRLELLFKDLVSFLEPERLDRAAIAAGDRCAAVVTVVGAEADAAGARVALDLVLDLPAVDDRLRVVLASLWQGSIAVSPDDGRTRLRVRRPGGP